MRTETPPPGARVTVTPATRPASICSTDMAGCRAISSDVTVEGENGGGTAPSSAAPSPAPRPWAHPRMSPATRPMGGRTRVGYQVMGPPLLAQYSRFVPRRRTSVRFCGLMSRLSLRSIGTLVSIVAVMRCGRPSARAPSLFKLLPPGRTGVTFANTITTNDSVNVQTEPYIYNGAGVAVGDIDNDGLPDIFFSGNMVSSRLYRNTGGMRFEDITKSAGVATNRWATGATMVDINNDGYLDIYVSVSGAERSKGQDRANLLFINNGDRTFTEAAARYGIADTGFTTHAVFLDYNRDGCLDLFLLNNSPKDFARGIADTHPLGVQSSSPEGYNKLYRNNCDGTFTDVSRQAGILEQVGYGLGVVVADVNRDGWPDIYVSNDVAPNDVLYINNRNGTFTDQAGVWLKHTSFAGMGVDIADFNNDGWPDILQMDMMPAALDRQKRMSGYLTYGGRSDLRRRGFRDAYDVNSLQLSNGVTQNGDVIFSGIAQLAGVASTDWSWSALFGDFDNDGYKDIFVTNGYPKAANDLDYQTAVLAARRAGDRQRALRLLKELHGYRLSNYVFRNNGDLTFTDETKAWGMDQPGFSYGAAYADLNNDGKLDLVVNNIDAPASIYENIQPADEAHHYLQVKLAGESPNRRGIGAQLILTAGGQKQYLYHSPYRGYMSTMDDREHFGLGRARRVPGKLFLQRRDGSFVESTQGQPWAADKEYDDWGAVFFDANGDGRPDLYVASGGYQLSPVSRLLQDRLYINRGGGRFVRDSQALPAMPTSTAAVAAGDFTGDGKPDLFVGGRLAPRNYPYPARSYLLRNDGGQFTDVTEEVAPELARPGGGGMITAAVWIDFDGDGRLDLVTAGEWMPLQFFHNEGGKLRNVTASIGPPPMRGRRYRLATGDFNHDGHPELVGGTVGLNL